MSESFLDELFRNGWTIRESFRGEVVEIQTDSIRLHTVSSKGEEAVAWMDKKQIPEDEHKWIHLGAVVFTVVGTNAKGTLESQVHIQPPNRDKLDEEKKMPTVPTKRRMTITLVIEDSDFNHPTSKFGPRLSEGDLQLLADLAARLTEGPAGFTYVPVRYGYKLGRAKKTA